MMLLMQVDDFVGAGEARNCILPRETASGDDSSGNAAVSKDSAARRSSQIANSRSRLANTAEQCVCCFYVFMLILRVSPEREITLPCESKVQSESKMKTINAGCSLEGTIKGCNSKGCCCWKTVTNSACRFSIGY